MRWLRDLLHLPSAGPTPPLPQLAMPTCVIGDIHGCLDILDALLDVIAQRSRTDPVRIVVVGDMIDRGPDSAGVLARLFELSTKTPDRVICLMGNHERMLLDFIENPALNGPRWVAAGGTETLVSFGLSPWARRLKDEDAMTALAAELRAAMPPDLLPWLTALPLIWQDDLLAVTHAGADPGRPITAQSERRLLWGARGREPKQRTDDFWVVHGHTIVTAACAMNRTINVDTGAWRTGLLSAAWIDDEGLSLISSSREK